jgi:hypothetical protein
MENEQKKSINWEKISVYLTGLAVLITLWTFLNQTQRDYSDLRERITRNEVKIEKLEGK